MLNSIDANQEIHFRDNRYILGFESIKAIRKGIANGAGVKTITLTAMIGEGPMGYDYTKVHFDLSLAAIITEG